MTPEKQQELNQHIQAIAEILYQDAEPEKIASLQAIEKTIREQTLESITPQLGFFCSQKPPELIREESEKSKVSLGNYPSQKNKQSD